MSHSKSYINGEMMDKRQHTSVENVKTTFYGNRNCSRFYVALAGFLMLAMIYSASPVFAEGGAGAKSGQTTKPGKEAVQEFDLSAVRLLDSPFKHAMEMDQKYMLELNSDRLLAPYFESAGLKPKAKQYKGWESTPLSGHILGHYLSATSMMYAATGDKRFKQRIDYIVGQLDTCQQAGNDGYIGGIPNGRKLWREVENDTINTKPFSLNGIWSPWYNLHKVYAGLRDAYLYTGNEEAKKVLIRFSDWAVDFSHHLTDAQFNHMLRCEYGGMNEVMADVYALTGQKKYLELSRRFNDKVIFDPLANGVDSLAGQHVNTQLPKIIGAAREYELDDSKRMQDVASYFWNEVTGKRIYINGEMGDYEHFGKLGDLHNRIGKASGETCNVYNMLKLTNHLMQWKPEARYAAYYERALYNDILASQDPETGMMTYFISLAPGFFKTFSDPFDSFWCCVGTGLENHAKYGADIYLHSDSDLYVNLFIPSVLNWKDKGLTLKQETHFPDTQKTQFALSLDHPQKLTLKIRHPYWATDGYTIKVNGKEIKDDSKPGSYVSVSRTWKDGDNVEVTLPMHLRVDPMPNDSGKVAIMYGPIVLAGKLGSNQMHVSMNYAKDQSDFFDKPTVAVPKLAIKNKPVNEWIKPVADRPLHFRTEGVGQPKDVELIPLYQANHNYYTVYWDVTSTD